MHLLLLSTYELGQQPFNLASPAAHLLAAGHTVHCLDLSVQPLDSSLVRQAQMVAISTPMHTALRIGLRVARRVRKLHPEVHINFFGLYAGLNADYLLQHVADSVIGGEFEEALACWAGALESEQPPPPGVQTAEYCGAHSFPRQRFLPPARHLLPPLEKYARLAIGGERRLVGSVLASRGCAHKCRHCPITPWYDGKLRIVQREVVLEDIAALVQQGARHITFADPDFLNGVRHSLAIVEEMHRRWPELTFDFTAKIEHLLQYRELLPALAQQGGLFVVSAVECLNDRALRLLQKGHTRADVAAAVQITRDAGIALRPSLLPFTPWTGIGDYLELLDFVAGQDLIAHVEPVQYAIRLLLPPGSPLLEDAETRSCCSRFDEEKFTWEWHHPDPRVDDLHAEVADFVERAPAAEEGIFETFLGILEIARRYAPHQIAPLPPRPPEIYPPRLTEDWFC